MFEVFRICKF